MNQPRPLQSDIAHAALLTGVVLGLRQLNVHERLNCYDNDIIIFLTIQMIIVCQLSCCHVYNAGFRINMKLDCYKSVT